MLWNVEHDYCLGACVTVWLFSHFDSISQYPVLFYIITVPLHETEPRRQPRGYSAYELLLC